MLWGQWARFGGGDISLPRAEFLFQDTKPFGLNSLASFPECIWVCQPHQVRAKGTSSSTYALRCPRKVIISSSNHYLLLYSIPQERKPFPRQSRYDFKVQKSTLLVFKELPYALTNLQTYTLSTWDLALIVGLSYLLKKFSLSLSIILKNHCESSIA